MISAAFSAIMMVGALVLPDVMVGITEVEIAFQAIKGRQDIVPAPLGASQFGPLIVVLGNATQGNGRVDRAGASCNAAPWEIDIPPVGGCIGEAPVMSGVGIVVAVDQVERCFGDIRVIGPCFDEQDRAVGVF